MGVKFVPFVYCLFGTSILFAQQPEIPPTTAAGALVGGCSLLLATLVWVVKRQYDVNTKQQDANTAQQQAFTAALIAQQSTFSVALEKQGMIFVTVLDKVREDNRANLKMLKDANHLRGNE